MGASSHSSGTVYLRGTAAQLSSALANLGACWIADGTYECSLSGVNALHQNRSVFLIRFTVQPSGNGYLISYRVKTSAAACLFTGLLVVTAIGSGITAVKDHGSVIPVLFLLCCAAFSAFASLWQRRKCILRFRSVFETVSCVQREGQ